MLIENEALFLSLFILGLIRFSGFLVSLDLFIRKKDKLYILFIAAWIFGSLGPILGISTLYTYSILVSDYLWALFSIFAGLSTILIIFGALSYFGNYNYKYILSGSILFIIVVIILKVILNTDIATQFALSVQIFSLIFLLTILITKKKLFIKLTLSSYIWLILIAIAGVVHILCFLFIYNNQASGFTGTSFISVLTIIFILHLEHDLAMSKVKETEHDRLTLFKTSPIGLALATMDGDLIEVNDAYASIIGRTVEETLSLNFWNITPPEYYEKQKEQLKKIAEKGFFSLYEKEYIHKNGHRIPVRLKGVKIVRNGINYIWSSIEDISQQKKLSEELNKYKDNLEQLVKEQTIKLEDKTKTLEKSQQALLLLLEDINESRSELEKSNKELEHFNDLFVNREFRIKELRDRVKELEGN
jgi:PAS domain S-box-containing protein